MRKNGGLRFRCLWSGVVVGVLIFTVLIYSLTILGIDTNLQFVFEGIIIITAVTLDCLKYVQKK